MCAVYTYGLCIRFKGTSASKTQPMKIAFAVHLSTRPRISIRWLQLFDVVSHVFTSYSLLILFAKYNVSADDTTRYNLSIRHMRTARRRTIINNFTCTPVAVSRDYI